MSEIRDTDIAVIGMACRFPGANNLEAFWRNICGGVESIAFFSEQELLDAGVGRELIKQPGYVPVGGILSDVEQFDAAFFGFSPREAAILDPQHRLFLECAWEALEHAGYAAPTYDGYISVHAGAGMNNYLIEHLYPNRHDLAATIDMLQVQTGNDKDHLATRVAYKLNLKGPSITVQTACSTSLVAIHLACQSLLNGESDIALAGGVTLQLPQKAGYLYREGMILSPDGHCRAFDSRARGTVGGSGAGVVVLKRLAHALAEGATIYAVVRGSAINNDGALKIGYIAPSVEGQKEVIAEALAVADVDPATITLVEAHGTGTQLGDPIEVAALTQAFGASAGKGYCALGSVKTNVGHLDTAAGVCGFIKAALALHHGVLPPSLHFERPNPNIDFANSPFYVNTTAAAWETHGHLRRAGVSSFGIGGTNVHVVLEEAPPPDPPGEARPWQLLALSAKTDTALETATRNLVSYLADNPDACLADVAYTLQVGRCAMPYRRTLVCRDHADAIARWGSGQALPIAYVPDASEPAIVFMFPGQGAQYTQMARDLYDHEPIFREQVDRCCELLLPHLGLDLREVLYPDVPDKETRRQGDKESGSAAPQSSVPCPERQRRVSPQSSVLDLDQTWLAQPALFVVEYALAQLWASWGIAPRGMIGHSVGEYVAACLSRVFSLEDALRLVAARGRLMQQMAPGAMLSVPLSEQVLRPLLAPDLTLAAVNGPAQCVVAGPLAAIAALAERLERQAVAARRLHTSHAFHSAMMLPVLEPFARQLEQIRLSPPRIPYLSNVTGDWITAEQATDPRYWVAHLHQTVRFGDGLERVLREPGQVLLEVGPARTLGTLAAHHPAKAPDQLILASLRHAQDRQPDTAFILDTLGKLWLAGVHVDWARLAAQEPRRRQPLPTYPFERQRYWIDAPRDAGRASSSATAAPEAKRADIAEWFYIPSWKRSAPLEPDLDAPTRWLLFVDAHGLGPDIAARLRESGQDVIAVRAGARFERLDEQTYTLDPLQSADYSLLFEAITVGRPPPRKIAHFWNIAPLRDSAPDAAVQDAGFYGMLFLAQAIGSRLLMQEIELIAVLNGLHSVTGDELLCPDKALPLGPCKVLAQEYPHKRSRCVDIVWPAGEAEAALLREQLLAELLSRSNDAIVAYRGRHRWVQIYEPAAPKPPAGAATRLKRHGVYMITGGLGGIGLTLAQHLARTAQARLALVGRSPLPEREAWSAWLSKHGDQDRTSRVIARLQQLERLGAELEFVAADVSDPVGMRVAVERMRARFGRIDGVIHAAGIPGESSIERKTPRAAAEVLAAKVAGTTVLDQIFRESPPDFFVLCSSLRAIIGGAGHVDYCAANAFLDAYAAARSQQARAAPPVIAINWDGWQDVGMSVETVKRMNLGPDALGACMTAQEGIEVFDRALNSAVPQVVVSTIALQAQIDRENAIPGFAPLAHSGENGSPPAVHPRPALATPYAAPTNESERILASIWQEAFGVDRVGIHDNFFELGGDSIVGILTIARAHELGLRLTAAQVFEHQTIARLASVAGSAPATADQGLASGPAPLTPIQRWFFEQDQPDIQHFNQAVLFKVPGNLAPAHLEAALRHVALHHDALRLRFLRVAEGWRQTHAPPDAPVPFMIVDLSALAPEQRPAALEAEAAALQAGLDITYGPVMRAALFTMEDGRDQRLLLIIHHLVVDGFSWRILRADLQTAALQVACGEAVALPPKTTSFQAWAERLSAHARGEHAKKELRYWLAHSRRDVAPIPRDIPDGDNLIASMRRIDVALDAAETQALLQDVPKAYHIHVHDVLVAALAKTLAMWTGDTTVVIDVEAQGRDLALDGVDISRTVGWFTALYPVFVTLDPADRPERLLGSVKEQLRAIPNNGLSYGALRYLIDDRASAERLEQLPRAEIVFLHLGQIDAGAPDDGMFAIADEPTGPNRSPRGRRPYVLEISSMIAAGCLRLEWLYSGHIHNQATIERLAQGTLDVLRSTISACQSAESSSYTPSDFPFAGLDERKLEKIAMLLGKDHQHKGR